MDYDTKLSYLKEKLFIDDYPILNNKWFLKFNDKLDWTTEEFKLYLDMGGY